MIVGRTTYEVVNTLIQEFGLNLTLWRPLRSLDSSRGGTVGKLGLVFNFCLNIVGRQAFLKEVMLDQPSPSLASWDLRPSSSGTPSPSGPSGKISSHSSSSLPPSTPALATATSTRSPRLNSSRSMTKRASIRHSPVNLGIHLRCLPLTRATRGSGRRVAAEQDVQLNASIRKITRDDHYNHHDRSRRGAI